MTAEERLASAFLELHPTRAAATLERMPAPRASAVLRFTPPGVAAGALRDMTVTDAADCLADLPPTDSAAIVAELAADDAAVIVRALRPEPRDALLAALDAKVRDPIRRVLRYPDGTAGAVMDPAIFQLPDDALVADARARLGRAARDLLYYLYVADREHRLVGVLDIPELMLARPRDQVSSAMHRNVECLSAWAPLALVREHQAWQLYHAMPVVDEAQRLVGAIRYQTLRRLEREASGRTPDPGRLTAGALAELFQLGTTGLVAGIAGARSAHAEPEGTGPTDAEAGDAR